MSDESDADLVDETVDPPATEGADDEASGTRSEAPEAEAGSPDAEPVAEATDEEEEEQATEGEGTGAEGEEAPAAGEPEDAAESAGFEEGDFVRLDYTIRTAEDGRLVDTTSEEIAEEEGIDTEEREFEPRTIVLGAGHVFDEVEEELLGKTVGDAGSVTIAAADAFGEYDADQVRTVSVDRIPEDERYPGGHVDIDGQHGHVETIIGGRARIDFNHPLAGEDIVYEYEVVGTVEDRIERARGLLDLYVNAGDVDLSIGVDEEDRTVVDEETDEETTETVEIETLYIESAPQLALNQQWLFSKHQIAGEIIDRIGVDRVIVREILEGAGPMGGMGGMLGGMGGGVEADLEEALEDVEVDADEIVDELAEDVDAEETVEK